MRMKPIHGDKLRGHLETLILSVLERGEAQLDWRFSNDWIKPDADCCT